MSGPEILESLKDDDFKDLSRDVGDEYLVDVINGEVEDKILFCQAIQLAVMNKYGVNSKEYAELIK